MFWIECILQDIFRCCDLFTSLETVFSILGFVLIWASFYNLSKFPMFCVKQLFSKYRQNNLSFTVFSMIMMHEMHASVNILLSRIKAGF